MARDFFVYQRLILTVAMVFLNAKTEAFVHSSVAVASTTLGIALPVHNKAPAQNGYESGCIRKSYKFTVLLANAVRANRILRACPLMQLAYN